LEDSHIQIIEKLIEGLNETKYGQEKILYNIILNSFKNPSLIQDCIDKFENYA